MDGESGNTHIGFYRKTEVIPLDCGKIIICVYQRLEKNDGLSSEATPEKKYCDVSPCLSEATSTVNGTFLCDRHRDEYMIRNDFHG